MYSHPTAAVLSGPLLISILTSDSMILAPSEALSIGADLALLALYRDKFRRNVEFYGRILMAHPYIPLGERVARAN